MNIINNVISINKFAGYTAGGANANDIQTINPISEDGLYLIKINQILYGMWGASVLATQSNPYVSITLGTDKILNIPKEDLQTENTIKTIAPYTLIIPVRVATSNLTISVAGARKSPDNYTPNGWSNCTFSATAFKLRDLNVGE